MYISFDINEIAKNMYVLFLDKEEHISEDGPKTRKPGKWIGQIPLNVF